MLPMLEMCGYNRVKHILYNTYYYTTGNSNSLHNKNRKKQKNNEYLIKSKNPYPIIFPSIL